MFKYGAEKLALFLYMYNKGVLIKSYIIELAPYIYHAYSPLRDYSVCKTCLGSTH